MWIRDSALWQQSRAEQAQHGELGQAFIKFVADWCERAESAIVASRTFQREDGTWDGEMNAAQALRDALPAAEQATGGAVSLSILAQAMVIILANWGPGPEVWQGLTVIESKVVGDMLAIKFAELEQDAVTAGG